MPFLAPANELVIPATYAPLDQGGATWSFDFGAVRVDMHVFDSDIMFQPAEDDPPNFPTVYNRESKVYRGFESIPFETPITGLRLRAVSGTARVTVRVFA